MLSLLTLALALPTAQDWLAWKSRHSKVYDTLEAEAKALEAFTFNARAVTWRNAEWESELGVYADVHPDEFNQRNGCAAPAAPAHTPLCLLLGRVRRTPLHSCVSYEHHRDFDC